MKVQKTLQLRMTKKNYKKLIRQANFLGTTRNNLIFLKLHVYRDVVLQEDEIAAAFNQIEQAEETETDIMVSYFPEYYQRMFLTKPLYLHTINEYASALFHRILSNEDNQWKEASEKSDKMNRIYHIEEELLNRFVDFSKEINISQKTLLNYAFMRDLQNDDPYTPSEKTVNRQRKGLEFTLPSIQELDKIGSREREQKINQLLAVIPQKV